MSISVFLYPDGRVSKVHLINDETDECYCGSNTRDFDGEWISDPIEARQFGVDLGKITCKRCAKILAKGEG